MSHLPVWQNVIPIRWIWSFNYQLVTLLQNSNYNYLFLLKTRHSTHWSQFYNPKQIYRNDSKRRTCLWHRVLRKLSKGKNNSFDAKNFLKFTFGFFSPLLICLGSSVKGRWVLKTSGFFKSFRFCMFSIGLILEELYIWSVVFLHHWFHKEKSVHKKIQLYFGFKFWKGNYKSVIGKEKNI